MKNKDRKKEKKIEWEIRIGRRRVLNKKFPEDL